MTQRQMKPVQLVLQKRQLFRFRVWESNDVSQSTQAYHNAGTAQIAFNRVFDIAIEVDDDGVLPVGIFSGQNQWMIIEQPMTDENNVDYVEKQILPRAYWGSTYLTNYFKAVLKSEGFLVTEEVRGHLEEVTVKDGYFKQRKFFGLKIGQPVWIEPVVRNNWVEGKVSEEIIPSPNEDKTWHLVFTDGDLDDASEMEKLLDSIQHIDMFIMFVGIGSPNRDFDDLKKWQKKYPNVDFVQLRDFVDEISDDEVYGKLISQKFADWANEK
jgi:hypothetical protein